MVVVLVFMLVCWVPFWSVEVIAPVAAAAAAAACSASKLGRELSNRDKISGGGREGKDCSIELKEGRVCSVAGACAGGP